MTLFLIAVVGTLALHARRAAHAPICSTTSRCTSIVMESEMEYRRRMSGDPKYLVKKAETTLAAATDEQAQRWLQLGGRMFPAPENAADILQRARAEAIAAGVPETAAGMQQAAALLKAFEGGPTAEPVPGAAPARESSDRYAMPGDFDGTRQSVARARRADRFRTSLGWDAKAIPPPSRTWSAVEKLDKAVNRMKSQPAAVAATELQGVIADATAAGVRSDAPAMRRATALATLLAAGEREDENGGEDADEDAVLDAKLDVLFANADPYDVE